MISITRKHEIEKNKNNAVENNENNVANSNVLDIMFKKSFMEFAGIYDEKFQNAELISTEYIAEKPKHRMMDIVLKIDDEYYDIEFQTGRIRKNDLRRFLLYHSMIVDDYQTENVNTIIIYTEKIKENTHYKTKNTTFKPTLYSLKNFDGDKILNNIKNKIKNKEEIPLKEAIHLAFIPLYQIKQQQKDMLYEACLITNILKELKIINSKNIDNIKIMQGMLVNKLVPNKEEQKRYLEVIKMRFNALETLIEESMEEGLEQGLEQGIEQGSRDTKFGIAKNMLKADISINQIMEFTGLSENKIKNIKNSLD